MNEIVTSVNGVAGYMSDITSASKEQSVGIEEVNQAVIQMDEATQQNAALVEQAAAAAEAMQNQAAKLESLVGAFKLVPGGQTKQMKRIPVSKTNSTMRALPIKSKLKTI